MKRAVQKMIGKFVKISPTIVDRSNEKITLFNWEKAGCYSSWCERGWYSAPAIDSKNGVVYASAYSVVKLNLNTGELIWRAPSASCVNGGDNGSHRTWPGIVLTDLHNNGEQKIVVGQSGGWLNVLDTDGNCESGYPKQVTDNELRSLAVKDISGDGFKEIVFTRAKLDPINVWVLDHNGNTLTGWPQRNENTNGSAAGVYDDTLGLVTHKGKEYIFVPSDVINIMAYTLDGKPLAADTNVFKKPTWGENSIHLNEEDDIRGYAHCSEHAIRPNFARSPMNYVEIDGEERLVVVGKQYDCGVGDNAEGTKFLTPYIFNIDRTRFNNDNYDWTVVPQTQKPIKDHTNEKDIDSVMWKPVTVDIDGDDIEILFAGSDGCLHAYNLEKEEPYSWPFCLGTSNNLQYFSEPVVADLDNDGSAEIIVTTWGEQDSNTWGNLFILNYKGIPIHAIELPKAKSASKLWNGAIASPSLGKLDGGEGDVVVVVNTVNAGFCAYRIPDTKEAIILWGTSRVKNLKFREQKFENINWQSDTLKELEFELEKYRIKQLENSPSWKVHKYLKIISIQNNINKQQRYLKWKGSTSILKLRNFTNYLNRYSYVMNKDKSKYCKLCKKSKKIDIIEDLDHFLWNCPAYENNRKIWISELKKFNISNILKNNITIFDIIRKRDSLYLLALIGNKFIFESLTKFLNHNLGIRANKRN
ncbi:protein defective in exine formation [Anaeramoeba flamelloides]|uniref:Protein defective in exine formation n=1 Tax=Anaeramoeba flamelloides TaxID=1746091 RepID=A0AAV7Z2V5_9EUKA|nr:protein defective in exine formation [Anaeramoeba flamelloides]